MNAASNARVVPAFSMNAGRIMRHRVRGVERGVHAPLFSLYCACGGCSPNDSAANLGALRATCVLKAGGSSARAPALSMACNVFYQRVIMAKESSSAGLHSPPVHLGLGSGWPSGVLAGPRRRESYSHNSLKPRTPPHQHPPHTAHKQRTPERTRPSASARRAPLHRPAIAE